MKKWVSGRVGSSIDQRLIVATSNNFNSIPLLEIGGSPRVISMTVREKEIVQARRVEALIAHEPFVFALVTRIPGIDHERNITLLNDIGVG